MLITPVTNHSWESQRVKKKAAALPGERGLGEWRWLIRSCRHQLSSPAPSVLNHFTFLKKYFVLIQTDPGLFVFYELFTGEENLLRYPSSLRNKWTLRACWSTLKHTVPSAMSLSFFFFFFLNNHLKSGINPRKSALGFGLYWRKCTWTLASSGCFLKGIPAHRWGAGDAPGDPRDCHCFSSVEVEMCPCTWLAPRCIPIGIMNSLCMEQVHEVACVCAPDPCLGTDTLQLWAMFLLLNKPTAKFHLAVPDFSSSHIYSSSSGKRSLYDILHSQKVWSSSHGSK